MRNDDYCQRYGKKLREPLVSHASRSLQLFVNSKIQEKSSFVQNAVMQRKTPVKFEEDHS